MVVSNVCAFDFVFCVVACFCVWFQRRQPFTHTRTVCFHTTAPMSPLAASVNIIEKKRHRIFNKCIYIYVTRTNLMRIFVHYIIRKKLGYSTHTLFYGTVNQKIYKVKRVCFGESQLDGLFLSVYRAPTAKNGVYKIDNKNTVNRL